MGMKKARTKEEEDGGRAVRLEVTLMKHLSIQVRDNPTDAAPREFTSSQ